MEGFLLGTSGAVGVHELTLRRWRQLQEGHFAYVGELATVHFDTGFIDVSF
jgi:hypothetical protein